MNLKIRKRITPGEKLARKVYNQAFIFKPRWREYAETGAIITTLLLTFGASFYIMRSLGVIGSLAFACFMSMLVLIIIRITVESMWFRKEPKPELYNDIEPEL